MFHNRRNPVPRSHFNLNITPIIDVVFLLIIFFMLVCQFIVAENFEVAVPDKAKNAIARSEQGEKAVTLTVTQDVENEIIYAVGAEKISAQDKPSLVNTITALLEKQFHNTNRRERIVCLRIDKDITYAHTQYALAGIAASSAANIQISAMKDKIYHSN